MPNTWTGWGTKSSGWHSTTFKRVEKDYPGVERLNVGAVMGMPLEVFKDQLTMFAEEVMPAFKGPSSAG